ncbi:ATP-binding protein [Candidatus Korobacter versatilis]|nr:ATP-binding protein [Candidatus Koribacter versatilis]
MAEIEMGSCPAIMDCSAFELPLPPFAPVLLESMRAIGYSFESAIADVIDNSISAGAQNIQIRFLPYDEPFVSILDDGIGMSARALVEAMRHGSQDPRLLRSSSDLGRFGLGLKTASLSQCRCLTVISKQNGELNARRWDLDLVEKRKDWILTGVRPDELSTLPQVAELAKLEHGTLVLWQRFDRLAAGESSIEQALGDRIDMAREHLSLVFHRFLASEIKGSPTLEIAINDNPLKAQDPFLRANKATQSLPEESLAVEGCSVKVAPFILPHISRLSKDDLRMAGGEEGLRRNQGFYVYRNKRLISWGSWFRLVRQEEMTKLARVRVDIPNALDHLWTLDVKKSAASPPEAIRNGLRVIVDRISEGSRRVYTFRGRRANADGVVHIWDRTLERGGVTYTLNREHPLIIALESLIPDTALPLFQKHLQSVERTFPFDSLYADMASERRPDPPESHTRTDEELYDLASRLLDVVGTDPASTSRFLRSLATMEPFSRYPESIETLTEKLEYVHRQRPAD